MRGPKIRTRFLALVLLLVCTGALSYETPPVPSGSAGGASLVVQVATTTAAIPASTWSVAVERGGGFSPGTLRPFQRAGWSNTFDPPIDARPPTAPVAPPHISGSALLGLFFAPANAPPQV
jgi:hypothetical protein